MLHAKPWLLAGGLLVWTLAPGGALGSECGNGLPDPTELCDDGNTVVGDGCSPYCIPEVCGDGILETFTEQCDDANTLSGDGCSVACACEPEVCGDGVLGCLEECEDGNTAAGDGCDGDCRTEGVCGNGIVESPEECDDGNTAAGDGCSPICSYEPIDLDDPDARRCVVAVNRAHAKVAKAMQKGVRRCVRYLAGRGQSGALAPCLADVDLGRATLRTEEVSQKKCRDHAVTRETIFAFIDDPGTVNGSARGASAGSSLDLLGDPDALAPAKTPPALCQAAVQRGMGKYLNAVLRSSTKAKAAALKGRRPPVAHTAAELTSVLSDVPSDARLARLEERWRRKAGKACAASQGALALSFPGACASAPDTDALVDCARRLALCHACESIAVADDLPLDCDAYAGVNCP